jgi:hypothetical protein
MRAGNFTAFLLLATGLGQALAQSPSHLTGPELDRAIRVARTQPIKPNPKPPADLDFKRLKAGYAFLAKHATTNSLVLATSSLAATFAARDIEPVLMQTGRLPNDFAQRMAETVDWVNSLYAPPSSQADFESREFVRAVELGKLHVQVGQRVSPALRWDRAERVPLNAQSFAFVLYTFSWWPIEAMLANGELDPAHEAEGLDGWFYLWRVFGHAMGAPDNLLPQNLDQAREVAARLRQAQYLPNGQPVLGGVPILMRGDIYLVASQLAVALHSKVEPTLPLAIATVKKFLALSPGECEALGLNPDPAKKLKEYAELPAR